jgi:hypothetical protein
MLEYAGAWKRSAAMIAQKECPAASRQTRMRARPRSAAKVVQAHRRANEDCSSPRWGDGGVALSAPSAGWTGPQRTRGRGPDSQTSQIADLSQFFVGQFVARE